MTCQECGHNHASDDARAIGRFGPTPKYVAKTAGTPPRETREEAEADECMGRQRRRTVPMKAETPRPTPVPASAPQPDPAPFPAALMETAARAKAWRDFLTQVSFSLQVWQLDADVRENCEPVTGWIKRCRDDLAGPGAIA